METTQTARPIITVRPQTGYQEKVLSSPADIIISGGASGAGKTYALLLEALRHNRNKDFRGIIFRRTTPQIRNAGGLWDTSNGIYPYFGADGKDGQLLWVFPSGAEVKMSHLEYENNKYDHQGAQYTFIGFDEVTHFSKTQFFYLLSRNRSVSGIRPYVRATCNPDPDSWVAEFIGWWIDQETGFPIPEREGVVRYFTISNDVTVWGDTKQEVIDKAPFIFNRPEFEGMNKEDLVKSFTFIHGSVHENKALLKANPQYLSNLLSMTEAEQLRLLQGNWKIRQDNSSLFDYTRINETFTNRIPESKERYITCDAARFGKDLAVIKTWQGWKVVRIRILTKSKTTDIVDAIEIDRGLENVPKSAVIVDQDGVGGGVVDQGGYIGFSGNHTALEDPATRIKENYANLKTQCYYRLAEKVNSNQIEITTDEIYIDGEKRTGMMLGSEYVEVRKLITNDLRSIRKAKEDSDQKKQINSKEAQKIILNGRSPDFGDTLMMRVYFDLELRTTFFGGTIS